MDDNFCAVIPAHIATHYSKLFHITSLDNALQIVRSGLMRGTDRGQHANFSAIRSKPYLAREQGISLEFLWTGNHIAYFGPFSSKTTIPTSLVDGPYLVHVFADNLPPADPATFDYLNARYWQSIIYPGATGKLTFTGVTEGSFVLPELGAKPWSIFKTRRQHYERRIKSLDALEAKIAEINTFLGKAISV